MSRDPPGDSRILLGAPRPRSGSRFLILGHAPTSVADRHYTTVPQDLLDEAIAWLGEELKIDEIWKEIIEAKEKKPHPSKSGRVENGGRETGK